MSVERYKMGLEGLNNALYHLQTGKDFKKKREKKIHQNEGGKYLCNWAVNPIKKHMSLLQERVTCKNCLRLIIKEWKRQISYMKGQPLKNAKEGLRRAKKQLTLLE